jgi:HD-like signal output (HDOD) protein
MSRCAPAMPPQAAPAPGPDGSRPPAGPGGTDAPESLATKVEQEIRSGNVQLPVLPEAAVRVRQVIAADGGLAEVVDAVANDPSLAAAILRYANSAAFAGLRDIADLHQAVMRLGLENVEQIVLGLSARNAFAPADPVDRELYRALWKHSMASALAARRLTPRTAGFSPDTAFLAGLLHDMGKIVVLRSAASMRRRNPRLYSFQRGTLLEFFSALHCRTGDVLSEAWHLPAEIRDVMRRHHERELGGSGDALVAVVQLANLVTTKLGVSLTPDPDVSLLDTAGAALLRLDDVKVANLLVEVEDDLAKIDDLLS